MTCWCVWQRKGTTTPQHSSVWHRSKTEDWSEKSEMERKRERLWLCCSLITTWKRWWCCITTAAYVYTFETLNCRWQEYEIGAIVHAQLTALSIEHATDRSPVSKQSNQNTHTHTQRVNEWMSLTVPGTHNIHRSWQCAMILFLLSF